MPANRQSVFGPSATTRRRRQTPEEVRERVLRAAGELTTEAGGLAVSPSTVNFELIVQHADVPRSAVYRIWPSKDEFMVEFLRYFAREERAPGQRWWEGTAAVDEETIEEARAVVYERRSELDTPDGRRAVLREAVRRGARRNFAGVLTSPHWRTYVALTAIVNSVADPDARAELRATLCEAEKSFVARMVAFYRGMGVVLGFRPRPSLRYEHFAAAGAAIVEGLALRHTLDPELVVEELTVPGPDGSPESWCLPALTFLGITETMLEADPDYPDDLPADPAARSGWLDTRITESLSFQEPVPPTLTPAPDLAHLADAPTAGAGPQPSGPA